MVLVAAAAAAGAVLVAQATPEPAKPVLASREVPKGDKPFAPICKSNGVIEGRPDPAWVGASFANDHCQAPRMPAPVDGVTASREQVVASMTAEKNYAAAAGEFERCVQDFVGARKAEAVKSGQSIDTPLVVIENHRIAASQRNTQLVAARVRATIVSFNEYGSDCGG
ncbi:MAG TPA: hypothetical protein VH189_08295 [Rhizomicrobium sp.]|nr:hypothetical protein [Rhizomicrobium sp.]